MAYEDILRELRAKLGDSPEENDRILREEGEKFAKEGNAEAFNAVGELLLEQMPESRRREIERLTHIDGERLDEVYDRINKLINEHNNLEAKPLAEKLYKKITVEFAETDTAKFVSLRNPFEDNLCQLLFKTDKVLNRAPFDFSTYLTTYAYILLETGGTIDAIPVLEKAISYNPVDVAPRFEMAEIYKLTKNFRKLFEVTRDTLKIASSPVAISRCYANVAYALTDMGEYEDAAAFYVASVLFAPNPAVPLEMQHLANLKGSPIVRPSVEQTRKIMEKHDINFGPDKQVLDVAYRLSGYYIENDDIPNALNVLKIAYNLTRDDNIKNIILKYQPDAPMVVPADRQSDDDTDRSGITRTVNETPEE